ncbi:transposase [Amphibacillus xylanus]|uniref:transposase n=1 Tax=Amphibacillus xylanus TaxID=1449 RepID=UPI0018D2EE4B
MFAPTIILLIRINNKIKVLSKVAYGYRNFNNFKKRIMIHFKFKSIETNLSKKMQKETR